MVEPTEKLTDPVGVEVPVFALTVAVILVNPVTAMLVGFADTVVAVATEGCTFHWVTRLYMSAEPRPVA